MSGLRRGAPALVAAAILAVVATAPAAAQAPEPGTKVTTKVESLAPDAGLVKESLVRVYSPLPAGAGAHPERCDWIQYLRFRNAGGPRKAENADAVLAVIPGFLGGAGYFDQVARHAIRSADAKGRDIEVWAMDRRSNCLEDHRGARAAARERDPSVAYEYYWGDRELDGKTFPGWVSQGDAAWLNEVGLKQTMEDWYTVLRTGIESRRVRARKVFCGGHSMGGPLTAIFASWDFDGDPETTNDAGYRQCAGFVGFDTRFSLGFGGGVPTDPFSLLLTLTNATSPYVNVPPIVPETIQLPPVFGVGAYFDRGGTDLLEELPRTLNIDLSQRFLFSRDAVHFATQAPGIRDFTLTNAVTLAGVFDDNSAPLSFLRASVGFLTGGPLTEKNFPSPDPTLALPEEPSTPLYDWQGYQSVGSPGNPVPLNSEGNPYTSSESEVSSLSQLARTMFEAPADFIEQYFPTRLLKDLQAVGNGNRSGDLSHITYEDGTSKRPAILVLAGDSDDNGGEDTGPPIAGEPPNSIALSRTITIPGYNHNDVLTAATRQNDGLVEPSSTAVARFVIDILKSL